MGWFWVIYGREDEPIRMKLLRNNPRVIRKDHRNFHRDRSGRSDVKRLHSQWRRTQSSNHWFFERGQTALLLSLLISPLWKILKYMVAYNPAEIRMKLGGKFQLDQPSGSDLKRRHTNIRTNMHTGCGKIFYPFSNAHKIETRGAIELLSAMKILSWF